MAYLKHPKQTPPGGWVYRQAGTGFIAQGDSLDALVQNVVLHRGYKGLEPLDSATVRAEVQRQICTRLGTNDCVPEKNDDWVPQTSSLLLDPDAIMAFSRAALEWIASGRQLASVEEKDRRKSICLSCVLNRPLTGCNCSAFYQIIEKAVPKERRDEGLGICTACSCSLVAKVNAPENVIIESNRGRKINWPVFCWQRDLEPISV